MAELELEDEARDRGEEPVARLVRLRELRNLDSDACAELTVARRLGFAFDGASPPGTTWERLHAWERAIYLRGDAELAERDRLALVADLAEHLAPILGTHIGLALVEMIGPAFGLSIDRAAIAGGTRRDTSSTIERARQGDETALSSMEARAAELEGKIKAKGGDVPTAAGEDEGPPDARARLGFTVRKV